MSKFTSGQVGDDSPFETTERTGLATRPANNVPAALRGTQEAAPIEKAKVLKIDVQQVADNDLMLYRLAIEEHLEELGKIKFNIDREIERRLNSRNARALPHPSYEKVELVDQWTPYIYDEESLVSAREILKEAGKDGDAAKIAKFVPEEVTVIPAHWEHGNPISISALIAKYGNDDTPLGEALKKCMTRESLGTKLVVKRKTT